MVLQRLFSNRAFIFSVVLIFFGVIFRLLPHPVNIAPIGALAIFAGAKLPRKWALLVPIGAMFLSDIFIGFHNVIAYTWGAYVLMAIISSGILKTNKSTTSLNRAIRIAGVTLSGSFLFFVITNFGVWLHSGMYARTLEGLIQSYVMALPFYQNSLIGDIGFTALLFTSYELVLKLREAKLVPAHNTSQITTQS